MQRARPVERYEPSTYIEAVRREQYQVEVLFLLEAPDERSNMLSMWETVRVLSPRSVEQLLKIIISTTIARKPGGRGSGFGLFLSTGIGGG